MFYIFCVKAGSCVIDAQIFVWRQFQNICVYICMKAISEENEQFSILSRLVLPAGISSASNCIAMQSHANCKQSIAMKIHLYCKAMQNNAKEPNALQSNAKIMQVLQSVVLVLVRGHIFRHKKVQICVWMWLRENCACIILSKLTKAWIERTS